MTNVAKELHDRTWRTQATHDRYTEERKVDVANDTCPLCGAPTIKEFEHWRIIPNKYPHDAVTAQHDMIIPKTHLLEKELSQEAKDELFALKYGYLGETYVFITEALPGSKSVPGHFHLHLVIPKTID